MEIVVNLVLLVTSGAAAFYCFALNRKLDALRKTETGLGASIAAMSKGIEDARGAIRDANEASTKNIKQLESLLDEAKEVSPKLDELIDVISELSEISLKEIASASENAHATISALTQKAGASIDALRSELDLTNDLLEYATDDLLSDEEPGHDDVVVFDIAPHVDFDAARPDKPKGNTRERAMRPTVGAR